MLDGADLRLIAYSRSTERPSQDWPRAAQYARTPAPHARTHACRTCGQGAGLRCDQKGEVHTRPFVPSSQPIRQGVMLCGSGPGDPLRPRTGTHGYPHLATAVCAPAFVLLLRFTPCVRGRAGGRREDGGMGCTKVSPQVACGVAWTRALSHVLQRPRGPAISHSIPGCTDAGFAEHHGADVDET